MAEPLVSVVVVSYNQAKFIRQMLDSLKSQTYTNWELIVADDASTDDSVAIFKNWLHENKVSAKEIFHPKNTGLATVLNEAIELCTGEYVKLIAADDYLHPKSIEKCVWKLEELGEEYGMVFTDVFAINDEGTIINDIADFNKIGLVDPETFRKSLRRGNKIAALSVLMRGQVLKETGAYHANMLVEDYQKWLQINEKYYIGYIPEKLCFYRLHESNISKTKQERIDIEAFQLMINYDHDGSLKEMINDRIRSYYYHKTLSKYPDLAVVFLKYPFRAKILSFCVANKLPFFFFRVLNKLT